MKCMKKPGMISPDTQCAAPEEGPDQMGGADKTQTPSNAALATAELKTNLRANFLTFEQLSTNIPRPNMT